VRDQRPVDVSIVIPVYDSQVLPELVSRIDRVFRDRPETEYELLLVDDGSPREEVWQTLERLAAGHSRLRALQLTRNFGQQAATLCGLAQARGKLVITLDDDLQHAPEDIPAFLAMADWDIVIGQLATPKHSPYRRFASRVKGWFDRILIGKPAHIRLSSFRMLSRTVVDGVLALRSPRPFLPAMMFHVSRRVAGVPVSHSPRSQGRSGYDLARLFDLFSNLLIGNSSFLLRWVGRSGIVFALLSVVAASVVVYRRLVHAVTIPGWASLAVVTLLLGGMILFSLGLIGEYLIRLVEIGEQRPTYVVRRAAESVPASPAVQAR
jgi:dolichol-phosphate mannosyltransferase/undecaprenyl-phosphate 4-deoxy-4-formamido-L-arabinose transferase